MKRRFVACLFLAAAAHAQWLQRGPVGGGVNVVRVTADRVYAGADEGLFATGDGGASWTRLLRIDDLARAAKDVVIDPQQPANLYVMFASRLFRSSDAGVSWRAIDAGLPVQRLLSSLTIDPANPSVLYLGIECAYQGGFKTGCETCAAEFTAGSGIYKSVDRGESWAFTASDLVDSYRCVRGVAADPLARNRLYAYSETLISTYITRHSVSSNGGVNWSDTNDSRSPSREIVAHPMSHRRYALANPGPLDSAVVSSDDGTSWRSETAGLFGGRVNAFSLDPTSERTLYVAAFAGLYVTRDGGATWTLAAPTSTFRTPRTVAVDPRDPRVIYLGTSIGLFISRDGGGTWSESAVPQTATTVTELAPDPAHPGTLYATVEDSDVPRRVLRSIDGGRTWEIPASGLLSSDISSFPAFNRPALTVAADGTPYVITRQGNGDPVLFKFVGGTWIAVAFVSGYFIEGITAAPRDASTLYAEAYPPAVFKTTDGGTSWKKVFEDAPATVVVDPVNPSTVYLTGSRLMKSVDGGATWQRGAITDVLSIAIAQSNASILYAGTNNQGIFRSVDSGASWLATTRPPSVAEGIAVDPRDANVVYVSTLFDGMFRTTDGGQTWSAISDDLPPVRLNGLALDPATLHLYALTYRSGIFVRFLAPRARVVRH